MSDTFAMNKVYEDDAWPWGDQRDNKKNPARVFWGCWPSTLLSILCFLFFYKNTVFPLKTGYFVHFSVLYLVSCFFCFFFVFLLIFPSLFFCCSLLPCFFAFVSRKNITFERFFFINYTQFCFAHCAKLSFLLRADFGDKFGWCSTNTVKIHISAQD